MHITNDAIIDMRRELVRRQKIYQDSANNSEDTLETICFFRGKAAAINDMIYLLERNVCND